MIKAWFVGAVACVLLIPTGAADAAEVKFLCPIAMTGVMADLVPQFERTSSHKVTIDYATVGVITDRILKGEAADVAIVTIRQHEDLQKQGKIVSGSRTDIAQAGYGVFVRQGAPKPNIDSVDALKRSLLAAKSITYGDPAGGGPSGIYVAGLMERLGIAAAVKPKTKLLPPASALEAVAKGEAEIGFGLTSVPNVPGVDLVGPLPREIQSYTEYVAGLLTTSKQAVAGKALISFLSSPAGKSALKAKSFEAR